MEDSHVGALLAELSLEERQALDRIRSEPSDLATAIQNALVQLSGGPPMPRGERFLVYLYVMGQRSGDPSKTGLIKIMELAHPVKPGLDFGDNLGDDWIGYVQRTGEMPTEALCLLDKVVEVSGAAKDMIQAIRGGLNALRNGGSLPDHQRNRMSSCWRWDEQGMFCQAVDALLLAIDRRNAARTTSSTTLSTSQDTLS